MRHGVRGAYFRSSMMETTTPFATAVMANVVLAGTWTREQTQPDDDELALMDGPSDLILFNDDMNTFEWVITCLMDICEHAPEQAQQCALIVHNNGKCAVRTGNYAKLQPMCSALQLAGLSVQIS